VGCPFISCATSAGFPAAVAAAQAADVAVVVVGLCSDDCPGGQADNAVHEGEGHDRVNITLPGLQEALVQAVVGTGKPTVVVLVHGGALAIDWTSAFATTIVDALYPGEMGGDAVAAVLFGDVSPSGRTTVTWYPSAFQAQRPNHTDMVLPPHDGIPGITHLYYTGPVLWPFGWGLSYTTFAFSWASVDAAHQSVDATALALAGGAGVASVPPFSVNITNTGTVTRCEAKGWEGWMRAASRQCFQPPAPAQRRVGAGVLLVGAAGRAGAGAVRLPARGRTGARRHGHRVLHPAAHGGGARVG
jgi:hypothetical protein